MSKIDSLIGQIGADLAAAASRTHVKDAKKSAPAVVSKKPAVKKAPAKKAATRKAPAKKAATKKAPAKKEAKKPAPKRVVKKVVHKKAAPAKKAAPVKKAPAKKAASALWIKPVEGAFTKSPKPVTSGRKSEALNFAPGERRQLLAQVRAALPEKKGEQQNSIFITNLIGSESAKVRSVLRSLAVEGVIKLELLDGRRNGMTITRL